MVVWRVRIPKFQVCATCGKRKPASAFYVRRNYKFHIKQIQSDCKVCFRRDARKRRKAYKLKYPLHHFAYRSWDRMKQRAKRFNLPADSKYYNKKRFLKMMLQQEMRCGCCGKKMNLNYGRRRRITVDRINPRLGYVKGNVGLICMRCNRIKNNATLKELRLIRRYMLNAKRGCK